MLKQFFVVSACGVDGIQSWITRWMKWKVAIALSFFKQATKTIAYICIRAEVLLFCMTQSYFKTLLGGN